MKKSTIVATLTALVALAATPVVAQSQADSDFTKTSFTFYERCHELAVDYKSAPDGCFWYLTGLIDGIYGFSDIEAPKHTTSGQLMLIVMKYMADHPEQLDQLPAVIVDKAIIRAYWKPQKINQH